MLKKKEIANEGEEIHLFPSTTPWDRYFLPLTKKNPWHLRNLSYFHASTVNLMLRGVEPYYQGDVQKHLHFPSNKPEVIRR